MFNEQNSVWIARGLDHEDAKLTKARSTKNTKGSRPGERLRASWSSRSFVTSCSKHLAVGFGSRRREDDKHEEHEVVAPRRVLPEVTHGLPI